ncbi:hypothetical protein HO173_004787 [Letharia columbiana]|uniref:Uncharacterized protein n=1 Tax=Letharia columbiana TaxID=112416 RepID=A0A8H6FYZ7_9LECA|nr:uncharacterized protein HO173_004787 [Letharia columbiana]KAF6237318.1 hypothetical protein HO173_004787 [Letharia columbiana]
MFKSMASILSPTVTSHDQNQSFVESDDPERSDPAVNSDALPDDHPIHLLPEARAFYRSGRTPPFVLNKRSEVIKSVVIPTKNGLRPKDEKAIKVKIVAKPWDKEFMFWTLDLNHTRYIVKPFNGQAQGGMRYLYWAGPGKDFEQKPLALSFISPYHSGTTISTRSDGTLPAISSFAPINRKRSIPTDSFDSSESSDSSDTSDSESEAKSTRIPGLAQRAVDAGPGNPLQQIDDNTSDHSDHCTSETNALKQPAAFQSAPPKRRKTEVSSREIDRLNRSSPPARRRSDVQVPFRGSHPEPAQPTTSASTKPVNDREDKRKQRAIARIEKDLGRKFDQIFTPWAGEDQGVSRNTLQMILKVIALMEDNSPQKITRSLNKAVNGRDGKRQPAGGLRPTGPSFKGLEATLQATKTATVNGGRTDTPSSPSRKDRQQLDQRTLQRTEAVSHKGTGPDPPSILLEGNRHQLDQGLDLDMSPSTILPQHKQNRTTLIVRVAPSLEYLPLKLSECMTPLVFYTKVISAWGIRGESVAKITATFTWMDPKDKMRTMLMNSKIQGCFAHMIEQVDEAPAWEEGGKGKCVLDVEIVLKE